MFVIRIILRLASGKGLTGFVQIQPKGKIEIVEEASKATRFTTWSQAENVALLTIVEIQDGGLIGGELDFDIISSS